MAEVAWSAAAIDQTIQSAASARVFNPSSAILIGDRLFEPGDSLASFPLRGTPWEDGTRAMVTLQTYIPTRIVTDDRVSIVDVRHGARERLRRS